LGPSSSHPESESSFSEEVKEANTSCSGIGFLCLDDIVADIV
jgi:hypothetical protein